MSSEISSYRAEIEAERAVISQKAERLLDEGRELDARLDRLTRSVAEWSQRAGEAGITRDEVIRLLELEFQLKSG